jgi:hypothetical protein
MFVCFIKRSTAFKNRSFFRIGSANIPRSFSTPATPPVSENKTKPANYITVGVPAYAAIYATTLGGLYAAIHSGILNVESIGLDPVVAEFKVTAKRSI